MSTGSNNSVIEVPTSNTNFSGTSYGTSVCSVAESWNFPSPRLKPKGLPPTIGSVSRSEDISTSISRTLGSGLSKNVRVGPPKYVMATNFVQTIVNSDSSGEADSLSLQALARFSSGDVNLGNFIGEMKSSLGMIQNRVKSIDAMVSSLIRGDFRDIERSKAFKNYPNSARGWDQYKRRMNNLPKHKRVANGWLELQFGWLPLLSDIWNATDAVRESYRSKGSTVISRSSLYRGKSGLRAQAGVWGQVSNPGLRSLSELGLLNPLGIAWELLPFSFVADYYVKIGELLTASNFNIGMSSVLVWKLHESRSETLRSGTSGSFAYPAVTTRVVENAYRSVTPSSQIQWQLPRVVAPSLNLSQVSTSIALLVQKLKVK